MAAIHPPPRHVRSNSEIERARETEWSLRALETELEAQACWRNGVEQKLRRQCDEHKAETDRLRGENARLRLQKLEARGTESEAVWNERSLEAELESQVQWQRSVADGLQTRLDDCVAQCARLRAENAGLRDNERSDTVTAEWRLRSLEADLEAQAQWRQGVADDLQRRLDEKTATEKELRAEIANLRA
jgi:hypothetical protein|tara:strand:+ start:3722 stop:4288 length:567 start_codon:yes stop_codon:yes gene_type:complete